MATYYLAPSGDDGGDGSYGSPWLTFVHAFSVMSAADELILRDGVYTTVTNGGISDSAGEMPPDGISKSSMTKITAETRGQVYVQKRLRLGSSSTRVSYIKIDGIVFKSISDSASGGDLYNCI